MSEDKKSEKMPTFGYRAGEAKIFELAPGETLPEGWLDTPQPIGVSPQTLPVSSAPDRADPNVVTTAPKKSRKVKDGDGDGN